jgi:hypothetical protein
MYLFIYFGAGNEPSASFMLSGPLPLSCSPAQCLGFMAPLLICALVCVGAQRTNPRTSHTYGQCLMSVDDCDMNLSPTLGSQVQTWPGGPSSDTVPLWPRTPRMTP